MRDWLNQSLGGAKDWLKQTAGKVSNGLDWVHQNIVQPGVNIAKTFGGDIGKFAEGVEGAANAVNDVNQAYRKGGLNGNTLKRGAQDFRNGVDRGRSAAGGAYKQLKTEVSKARGVMRRV